MSMVSLVQRHGQGYWRFDMFEDHTDYRSIFKRFLAVQSTLDFRGLDPADIAVVQQLLDTARTERLLSGSRRSAVFTRAYSRSLDESLEEAATRVAKTPNTFGTP